MAKVKTDYSKKTALDLQKKIGELRSHLQQMNFKVVANQLRGIREVRVTKKEIARLMSAMKTAK